MGFTKEEQLKRVLRGVKTLFFLVTMFISFLVFSAPVFLAIADAVLPVSLLSASLSLRSLSSHFSHYDFRYSLIDIPLISVVRSAIIICIYSFCDGPRLSNGPYLGITTLCSILSLIYVSFKASFVFTAPSVDGGGYLRTPEIALFVCSLVLAIGHVVVAYRTSCRERRKLLVYKIDIEALIGGSQPELARPSATESLRNCLDKLNKSVFDDHFEFKISAYKNGFPRYQKFVQEDRGNL